MFLTLMANSRTDNINIFNITLDIFIIFRLYYHFLYLSVSFDLYYSLYSIDIVE